MDGEGPEPFAWQIGQFCRFFHCTPTVAMREWRECPVDLMETIMLYDAYAHAKHTVDAHDAARTPSDQRPKSALITLVQEVHSDLVSEAREAARRG